jgi:hypothetical protein
MLCVGEYLHTISLFCVKRPEVAKASHQSKEVLLEAMFLFAAVTQRRDSIWFPQKIAKNNVAK